GPDSSFKSAISTFFRLHVEHKRANFAEEFATNVFEIVGLAIKVSTDHKHLSKTAGKIFHRIELRNLTEQVFGDAVLLKHRLLSFCFGEVELPKEVLIVDGMEC